MGCASAQLSLVLPRRCAGRRATPPGHRRPGAAGNDVRQAEPSASPADLFTEKSQFDMSLILKPHDVLFRFPFISENGELISAAHELNELNITPNVQSIRSNEEMFAVCQRFGITITNSDLYHVLPHEIITPSVINLWSQWYVIILGTVSHPIQNRSIRSN